MDYQSLLHRKPPSETGGGNHGGVTSGEIKPSFAGRENGRGRKKEGCSSIVRTFLLIFETIESGNLDFLDSFYLSINHKTTFTTLKSSSDDA